MKLPLLSLLVTALIPAWGLGADESDAPPSADVSQAEAAFNNQSLTLADCYGLALKQSELLAVDSERIKEAEAHFLQALGTILPQVSFSREETRQNSSDSPSSNNFYEQKFVFQQALFTGFKEFAAISASKLEKKQRENERSRAEQLLFTDVSDAFYLLLEERDDLKTLETIKSAFLGRLDELQAREKLGKSRTSEVVSTQTQLYSLEDQIELVRSQEQVARQLLEFLVGRPVEEITDTDFRYSLKPEPDYLARAALRPDVQAAQFAWKADEKGVTIARSGWLPSISLEGDYYTHRSSQPTDSDWEALLTINVPIFLGTTVFGQVNEAVAIAKESELLFQRAGRLALREIHDSYVIAQASFSRVKILETALKSAELNYELQTKDYQLNVVNNLDVLTAIQELEDIRRNFTHVSYESKRFFWRLQAAAGEIDLGR
ncbi:MAG: TolC family protein [Candidatus Aureabacteria bacterium]|nr:TolC family protein [Candidatus Auribacterota bacterium]